jgi:microcystin-dependent protein
MRGAVFGDDEIPKDQAGGVPVVLVPVNKKCGDCEVVEWRLSIPENNQIPGVFGVPTGTVLPFAGDTLPADYLMCDGSEVSRTQYAALYAAIGTIYGGGDGVTTFNLPDLRGRAPFGRDDMGGTAASRVTNTGTGNPNIDGTTLGAAGGADRHQLTIPQMPEHTHDYFRAGSQGSSVLVDDGLTIFQTPTSPAGGDEPHPQMPPAIILNYIIKY